MSKLIGNKPNQVPSNADLGTAAFADDSEFLSASRGELSAIDATIDTGAFEVFVYDTRKDSDGGAWRKRCQHLSWYNEELNTEIRGSRREFPSIAVIVIESLKVTIFDGDDPSMPMWMVFDKPAAQKGWLAYINVGYSGSDVDSIKALNGIISIGVRGTYGGLLLANLLTDKCNILYAGFDERQYYGNFTERNIVFDAKVVSSRRLINRSVTDTALKVLPNASIDDESGLPIPTIAVSTSAGITILHSDGKVVNIDNNAGTNYANTHTLRFNKDNQLQFLMDASNRYFKTLDVPYEYTTVNQWDRTADDGVTMYISSTYADIALVGNHHPIRHITENAVGTDAGLTRFDTFKPDARRSMFNYTTSEYNTGWSPGYSRLLTLNDTDTNASSVNSPELVTNGTFTSNIDGWVSNLSGGIVQWDNGTIYCDNTGTGSNEMFSSPSIPTIPNKTYVVSFKVVSQTPQSIAVFNHDTGGTLYGYSAPSNGETITFSFVASTTSIKLRWRTGAAGYVTVLDDVSCREAVFDRGEFATHLQAHDVIKKAPVAVGAELVAYNFPNTSSKIIQHAPNASLSADFTVSLWVKSDSPDSTVPQMFIANSIYSSPNNFRLFYESGDFSFRFGSDNWAVSHSAKEWTNVILTRIDDRIFTYINGESANTPVVNSETPTLQTYGVTIGNDINGAYPCTTSWVSLVKMANAGLTKEQVKKAYNDEKHLFKKNAKATLYGTSDDINGLAYDEDTNLTHVGTVDGRSVFEGLKRVEHTTSLISAGISVSNGFVVEG